MGIKLDKLGVRALLPKIQPETVKAKAAEVAQKATGWLPKAPTARPPPSAFANDFKVTGAPTGAVSPEFTPVDIKGLHGKRALIAQTSQVNGLSESERNSNSICSGAAIANALVLSGKSPAGLKANADALMAVAKKTGAGLSPMEKGALERMGKGAMTPADLQMAQQVAYRIAVKDSASTATPKLADAGDMARAAALLRAEGAFKEDPSVTFMESELPRAPGQEGVANHWAVFSNNTFASSLSPDGDGKNGGTEVLNAPPEKYTNRATKEWKGTVEVTQPSTISVTQRNPPQGSEGLKSDFTAFTATFDANEFSGPLTREKSDALNAKIRDSKMSLIGPDGNDPFRELRRFMPF